MLPVFKLWEIPDEDPLYQRIDIGYGSVCINIGVGEAITCFPYHIASTNIEAEFPTVVVTDNDCEIIMGGYTLVLGGIDAVTTVNIISWETVSEVGDCTLEKYV